MMVAVRCGTLQAFLGGTFAQVPLLLQTRGPSSIGSTSPLTQSQRFGRPPPPGSCSHSRSSRRALPRWAPPQQTGRARQEAHVSCPSSEHLFPWGPSLIPKHSVLNVSSEHTFKSCLPSAKDSSGHGHKLNICSQIQSLVFQTWGGAQLLPSVGPLAPLPCSLKTVDTLGVKGQLWNAASIFYLNMLAA